jgi:hypothetical protein
MENDIIRLDNFNGIDGAINPVPDNMNPIPDNSNGNNIPDNSNNNDNNNDTLPDNSNGNGNNITPNTLSESVIDYFKSNFYTATVNKDGRKIASYNVRKLPVDDLVDKGVKTASLIYTILSGNANFSELKELLADQITESDKRINVNTVFKDGTQQTLRAFFLGDKVPENGGYRYKKLPGNVIEKRAVNTRGNTVYEVIYEPTEKDASKPSKSFMNAFYTVVIPVLVFALILMIYTIYSRPNPNFGVLIGLSIAIIVMCIVGFLVAYL